MQFQTDNTPAQQPTILPLKSDQFDWQGKSGVALYSDLFEAGQDPCQYVLEIESVKTQVSKQFRCNGPKEWAEGIVSWKFWSESDLNVTIYNR